MDETKKLDERELEGVTGGTDVTDMGEISRFCMSFAAANCYSCAKHNASECHYPIDDMTGMQKMYESFKDSQMCPDKE